MPILLRDLRAETLSRRLLKARLLAATVAGVLLMILAVADRRAGGLNLTRLVTVVPFMAIVPFILMIMGLSRSAGLLSVERSEGTLPLLLLTRLTGHDIVQGKLLQAILMEMTLLLSAAPALVLPLLAIGVTPRELWLTGLGAANVLFFALALGLLASVFGDGPKMISWCLLLTLPWLAYSTPLAGLFPGGRVREVLMTLQWFNPCNALTHVQIASSGMRSSTFWIPLIASHAAGWVLLGLAGYLLPVVSRWRASRDGRRAGWRRMPSLVTTLRSRKPILRERLLGRNAFLWLAGREYWPTLQVWLLILLPATGCGWLAWTVWAATGANLTAVLVVAAASTWIVALLTIIPREASRRLIMDRDLGTLDLLLCTPLDVQGIVRGQWLALLRRYLLPVSTVIAACAVIMYWGYVTFGFGGMLDPEDRGLWLFSWGCGIVLLPVLLASACWVAMWRALAARTAGEASGIALLQVLGIPGLVLWAVFVVSPWAGWDFGLAATGVLLASHFACFPVAWAIRARIGLAKKLRHVVAQRYAAAPAA